MWVVCLSITIFMPPVQAIDLDAELPESLSKWYKPQNKRQVWLHTMFGMRRELQAVEEYVEQKDLSGINKWTDRLIAHYKKIPEMVPEWQEQVDLEIIKDLEEAVQQNKFSHIRFQLRRLQKNCRSCHQKYRVMATLRFRSADFASLKISSEGKDYKYPRFMKIITRSLNKIRIAAEDEHWDSARDASRQFKLELEAMGENCSTCHKDNEPYERILGASTLHSIKQMDAGIAEQNIKTVKLGLGETAVKVCARCHGVHRTLSEIRGQLLSRDSEH